MCPISCISCVCITAMFWAGFEGWEVIDSVLGQGQDLAAGPVCPCRRPSVALQ
jgi:hypothetical protein